MKRKLAGYLGAIALIAGGTVTATASPAFAVGGCDQGNSTVGACFDYSGGSNARADFYMNRTVDSSYKYYRVWMRINGGSWVFKGEGSTVQGRNCCWYHHVDALPDKWQTGQTRVTLYTSTWAAHTTSDSPIISFYA
ncbi:hypothetical protein [Micromonospora sp. NPDC048830]|uniref:hypothetical protein n=1 Tax=Micromonospora sp. NPDC048830 TaxID=3364257 RepID=UPI0037106795